MKIPPSRRIILVSWVCGGIAVMLLVGLLGRAVWTHAAAGRGMEDAIWAAHLKAAGLTITASAMVA